MTHHPFCVVSVVCAAGALLVCSAPPSEPEMARLKEAQEAAAQAEAKQEELARERKLLEEAVAEKLRQSEALSRELDSIKESR